MTFIPTVGNAIGPIVVVFVLAVVLALVLTPVVRRIVIRYEIVDRPEARRVNTMPVPRGPMPSTASPSPRSWWRPIPDGRHSCPRCGACPCLAISSIDSTGRPGGAVSR